MISHKLRVYGSGLEGGVAVVVADFCYRPPDEVKLVETFLTAGRSLTFTFILKY